MGKRVLVLGATGPLGIHICEEGLKHGYNLTVYARNPDKLPKDIVEHTNVKIIKGELTDAESLKSAVAEQDAIISALGPVLSLQALSLPAGTYTDAYRLIFSAMRQHNVKRIFIMGTPSIQDAKDNYPFTAKAAIFLLKTTMGAVYREVVAIGKLLDEKENEDLDWTMYRVGNLKNLEGEMKAGYIGEEGWGLDSYRPDIARWLIEQVGNESLEWARQKPSLWSKPKATS